MKKLLFTLLLCLPLLASAQPQKTTPAAATDAKKATAMAVADVKNGEKMPRYTEGDEAMNEWIYKNLKYPYAAQERGIQGTVYIRFIVSETGKVEDVKILRGIDKACDAEAVRVVQSLSGWTPGQVMGKNAAMPYMIRIAFKLPAEKS